MERRICISNPTFNRQLEHLVTSVATKDGAGVSMVRVLTHDLQRRRDPFLMLDNFQSGKPEDYGPACPTTRTAASKP